MAEVISVRFKNKGKVYFFDPAGVTAKQGDSLVVETAKGLEFAECVAGNHQVDDAAVRAPLRPVIRLATAEDERLAAENRAKEAESFDICRRKIEERNLEMKLVDVEFNFEGNKILFFFTSDGRVDFRELVKDLAGVFKTRIELRQIGVRDEARMLGGLGICGRPFCCAQFLDDFQPVSIKMAKTQGFSLNPAKISGACGRLMCCLKYEEDAYEELVKLVPKVDSFVDTPAGKGSVIDVNLLKSTVRVKIDDSSELMIKTFNASEITVLGGKAKRAEYLQQKAEGKIPEEKPAVKLRRAVPVVPVSPAPEVSEKPDNDSKKRGGAHKPPRQQHAAQPESRPAEKAKPEAQPRSEHKNYRRYHKKKGFDNRDNAHSGE
ncbi:MAG: stage 0 sporulation family protein [Oscillospiraceae bacterium]|nr:stage 0 sporulation family protein [Oscillospiraceae bacterium]